MKTIRSSDPAVLLGKGVLKICSKLTGEHPWRSSISIKLLFNFIEITLRHGCSSVNLLHIFRTPFLKNTPGKKSFWKEASVKSKIRFSFILILFCYFYIIIPTDFAGLGLDEFPVPNFGVLRIILQGFGIKDLCNRHPTKSLFGFLKNGNGESHTRQDWKFPADLVKFTEEILNGKRHFLCSDRSGIFIVNFEGASQLFLVFL